MPNVDIQVLTQVEKYGPDPAGRHWKSTENGSRNPLKESGGRIYPVLPGTERNRINPATGSVQRIPASVFRRFSAGNGVFPVGSRRKRRLSGWIFTDPAAGIIDMGIHQLMKPKIRNRNIFYDFTQSCF